MQTRLSLCLWAGLICLAATTAIEDRDSLPGMFETSNDVVHTEPVHKPSRRHKVHNLVLNPDKHSWCELKPIRQIVTHSQCTSKEMENFVCVGTCFSYTVPQTEPEAPGDELLDYCDSCSAAESHWTEVSLDCEHDGLIYQVTKNIQVISNCSCLPCRPPPGDKREPPAPAPHPPGYRISEIVHKKIPEQYAHRYPKDNDIRSDTTIKILEHSGRPLDLTGDLRYTRMSLGDLRKEFHLNDAQAQLLHGKVLVKDKASFDNDLDDDWERGYISY